MLLHLFPLALVALAACASGSAQRAETLPPGTDPDKVRTYCTDEAIRAGADVGFPKDYVAARTRAQNEAFAACMARNNVRP
jgi:hypothetical protein